MSKCCICGKEENLYKVKCTVSKDIKEYCLNCLRQGLEDYQSLVQFGWKFRFFNDQFRQKLLLPTLVYNNKSVQQFDADVDEYLRSKLNEHND